MKGKPERWIIFPGTFFSLASIFAFAFSCTFIPLFCSVTPIGLLAPGSLQAEPGDAPSDQRQNGADDEDGPGSQPGEDQQKENPREGQNGKDGPDQESGEGDPGGEGAENGQDGYDDQEGKTAVISVAEDDPEMVAAIRKARSTLPYFWHRFKSPGQGEESFMIKVMIQDSYGIEHFWCGRLKKEKDSIECTIANEPGKVRSVAFGQVIRPEQKQITDWMFRRNGYIHGNFTMRVLIKRMPPDRADYYRSMLAEPGDPDYPAKPEDGPEDQE